MKERKNTAGWQNVRISGVGRAIERDGRHVGGHVRLEKEKKGRQDHAFPRNSNHLCYKKLFFAFGYAVS